MLLLRRRADDAVPFITMPRRHDHQPEEDADRRG
jgi:hypothetical protein